MFSCIAECETSLEFLQSQVWIRVVLPLVVVGVSRVAEQWSSGLILWRAIPFTILWFRWRERNNRIFRSVSSSLYVATHARIAKWALVRQEFLNFGQNYF